MNPVAVLIGILTIFAGMWGYAWWYKRRRIASYPKTWIQQGATPPEGVERALEVVWECRPDKTKSIRWGGILEWTTELPFNCGCISAAGCVLNSEMPHLKISVISPIEKSAFAHEVGHYLWQCTYDRVGEKWATVTENGITKSKLVLDPDFSAWLTNTNAAIAKALGR